MISERQREGLRDVLRNGANVYGAHGLERQRSNVCERWFTVYVGNYTGGEDTLVRRWDAGICREYLGRYCVRRLSCGQMEYDERGFAFVSWISTPAGVLEVIRELRRVGVCGSLLICVEYVEGVLMDVKEIV